MSADIYEYIVAITIQNVLEKLGVDLEDGDYLIGDADTRLKANLIIDTAPKWGTVTSETLHPTTNPDDEITVEAAHKGLLYLYVVLKNLSSDEYDIILEHWDGGAWVLYAKIEIDDTLLADIKELAFEGLYIDPTYKWRISCAKTSGTDRDIPYRFNIHKTPD